MISQADYIKGELLEVLAKLCVAVPIFEAAFSQEAYIAGGVIVSLVLDEPIQDYDFFFKNQDTADTVNSYFRHQQQNNAKGEDYEIRAVTKNGVTLKLNSGEIIQLVTRFSGMPDKLFKSFDWEHCKCYYDFANQDLTYNSHLILSKELVYTEDDNYPVNALKRAFKFVKRGYTISPKEILKVMDRANKLDLSNEEVRGHQLIGFYS